MWDSTGKIQILSRKLPEQSGRRGRTEVLEEMWRAGSNELVIIVVEENKASLVHFLSTEISQHYETHPRRELVVSGGLKDILKV